MFKILKISMFLFVITLWPVTVWAQDNEAVLNALNQILDRIGKIEGRLDTIEGGNEEAPIKKKSKKRASYKKKTRYKNGWVIEVTPSNSSDSLGTFIYPEVSPVRISENGGLVSDRVRINLLGQGIFIARKSGRYTFICKYKDGEKQIRKRQSSRMRSGKFVLTVKDQKVCNMKGFNKAGEHLVSGGVNLKKGEYITSFSTKISNSMYWNRWQKEASPFYLYVREPGSFRPRPLSSSDVLHIAR